MEYLAIGLFIILFIAAGLALLPRLLYMLADRQIQKDKATARTLTLDETDPLLTHLDKSRPAIVYFTAKWCGPCRTTQTPVIEQLVVDEDIQLCKVDVDANPDVAERWGVRALPRTFVLRPDLSVHATNIDLVSRQTLLTQLHDARHSDKSSPVRVYHEQPDTKNVKIHPAASS